MKTVFFKSILGVSLILSSQAMANEKIMVDKSEYEQLKATVALLMKERDSSKKAIAKTKKIAEHVATSTEKIKAPVTQVADIQNRKSASQFNGKISGNGFNPAISLILDGRYTDIDSTTLSLPGFQLGGEAGLPEKGFSTGHNELHISANIDDTFFGLMTAALVYDDGETAIELEEAYIETVGLGNGFKIKGGQFFSGIGYLNSVHDHAHDFTDRPLVYDALFGGHLLETGVQASWVAPTDFYLNLGAELLSGKEYPSGDNKNGRDGLAFFAKTGGDIGASASWQLGASYYKADFDVREAGGHHHGEEDSDVDNELRNGDVNVAGVDFVYKWAPNGNSKNKNFTLQGEYFLRNEKGRAVFVEDAGSAAADYDGEQSGFYAQGVYQFMPSWRVGMRYEQLEADNRIANFTGTIDEDAFLDESGLGAADDPKKYSFMVDYSPSHFSRIRLQYSELDNGLDKKNNMILLQYLMSLGSHGAHRF